MSEPYEFDALALYHSECARGIVHTAEYDARMAAEQERFDADLRARHLREGFEDVPGMPGAMVRRVPERRSLLRRIFAG